MRKIAESILLVVGILGLCGVILSIKKDLQEVKTLQSYQALALEKIDLLIDLRSKNDN